MDLQRQIIERSETEIEGYQKALKLQEELLKSREEMCHKYEKLLNHPLGLIGEKL